MSIIVKSRDSLLTTSSGYTNYRGILNLVIILLVLSNARAALENIIKYGILVDPLSWFLFLIEGSKHWPALLIIAGLSAHILLSWALEKLIALIYKYSPTGSTNQQPKAQVKADQAAGTRSSKVNELAASYGDSLMLAVSATIFLNLFACIALPPLVIYTHDTHPISTSGSLLLVSIVFLKLLSYHMMNFWCRDARKPEQQQSLTTRSFIRSYNPPAVEFGLISRKKSDVAPPITNNNNNIVLNNKGCDEMVNKKPPKLADCVKLLNNCNNESDAQELRHRIANGISSKVNGDRKLSNSEASPSKQVNGHGSGGNHHNGAGKELALAALSNYPNNLTFDNLVSYMSYPTLCYELEYAKTERIRKRFLIKRILELIILSQLDMALVQQWIVPTVSNSVLPFRQMQLSHMLERLLKLAIPNHVIWLIWFYLFFHSLLNIQAELTRFADREFYRDWWNSESVSYFWSNWNIPVHKWCARHLYVPLMSLGLTKCQASTAVFFVSAFFHEYLVSVPLKMFRMWAFTGMLIQLPWARFVSSYFNSYFANVAVWVSLIIGQPLCILMYYHDYYVINHQQNL